MICKHCKKEIGRVRVYSECWQFGTLEGNKIADYGRTEEITDDTIAIECPECGGDLESEVEQ